MEIVRYRSPLGIRPNQVLSSLCISVESFAENETESPGQRVVGEHISGLNGIALSFARHSMIARLVAMS